MNSSSPTYFLGTNQCRAHQRLVGFWNFADLAEWNRVVPLLLATRILSLTHEKTLAAYCDCVADVEIASKELTRDGQTILDSIGKKINHPAWARKRDARAQMLRYASEFGLTPSAQAKVSVVAGPVLGEGIDPRIFG
ncbi:MAG: phage terminase small subunit P27 family [Planctomycetia bacterium]|nr:phage terminase small subunit P27 family [Planctomycetia bacterium]